jgi:carbon-monoxide dehydrogenase large subunit
VKPHTQDYRFLVGTGTYTDDIQVNRQTYAVFVRSPHAHARIVRIETGPARSAPGVIAVFTGEDTAAAHVGSVPCGWLITDVNGQAMKEPPHPPLAQGKVRYVGDQVAVVIAETRALARDAAELVEVEYQVLPAVAGAADARATGTPAIHDVAPDNTCYVWAIGDKAAVEHAFASAAHVTRLDLINNRIVPNAIEPRVVLASYNRADDSYTVYVANQNPHVERWLLSGVLGVAEHRLRVIAPDVGGGFGSKIFLYAEDVLITWASRQINRPVKWTSERGEAFLSDAHARDHVTAAELALDSEGRFLALRVRTTANLGAYLSTFGSCVPSMIYATLLAGQYCKPAIYARSPRGSQTPSRWMLIGARDSPGNVRCGAPVETAARELNWSRRDLAAQLSRSFYLRRSGWLRHRHLTHAGSALKLAKVAEFPARKADAARREATGWVRRSRW